MANRGYPHFRSVICPLSIRLLPTTLDQPMEQFGPMIRLLFGPDSPLPEPAVELVLSLCVIRRYLGDILTDGPFLVTSRLFGDLHGPQYAFYRYEKIFMVNYKCGALHGRAQHWYSNGQLRVDEYFGRGGPHHHTTTYWSRDGKTCEERKREPLRASVLTYSAGVMLSSRYRLASFLTDGFYEIPF